MRAVGIVLRVVLAVAIAYVVFFAYVVPELL